MDAKSSNEINELSDFHKRNIDKGIEDIKNGKFLPSAEVSEKVKKLLVERLEHCLNNPEDLFDFDQFLDELEAEK